MESKNKGNEISLPENASRELKDGEEYIPIMKPDGNYHEVNMRSVLFGLLMAIVFSAAAAYLDSKLGKFSKLQFLLQLLQLDCQVHQKEKTL